MANNENIENEDVKKPRENRGFVIVINYEYLRSSFSNIRSCSPSIMRL